LSDVFREATLYEYFVHQCTQLRNIKNYILSMVVLQEDHFFFFFFLRRAFVFKFLTHQFARLYQDCLSKRNVFYDAPLCMFVSTPLGLIF
jgi:hypothetical protein